MKILVSTSKTQGRRESDFCFVPDGEIVVFGHVCDRDKNSENPDVGCGCGRSMVGSICAKATTTVEVAESDMTSDQFVHHCQGAMQDMGWTPSKESARNAKESLRIAHMFQIGSVLEFRKNQFLQRAG